nr:MAG TPA: BM2 protein [Bacteriophage sp.]
MSTILSICSFVNSFIYKYLRCFVNMIITQRTQKPTELFRRLC